MNSGKPGTWAHYEMAVKAHLAVVDLLEFLHDGAGLEDVAKANWVKGQQKIYSHFILTCDDRAATTLLSIDATQGMAQLGSRGGAPKEVAPHHPPTQIHICTRGVRPPTQKNWLGCWVELELELEFY